MRVLAIAAVMIGCDRGPMPVRDALRDGGVADRDAVREGVSVARDAVSVVPDARTDGIALPMPVVLPCPQATNAYAGGSGYFGQTLELLDERGGVLARVRAPSGDRRRPDGDRGETVAIDLGALHRLAFVTPDGSPSAWLHLRCHDAGERAAVPGISWACYYGACTIGGLILDAAPIPEIERNLGDCQAAAEARQRVGACRAALTAEVQQLGADLADLFATACDRGTCTDELLDLRRLTDAIAWSRLRYTSTGPGPLWRTTDEDDPPPQIVRHDLTDGTITIGFRCVDEAGEAPEPRRSCLLHIPTPTGPLVVVRDISYGGFSISHGAGVVTRAPRVVVLSHGAMRLRSAP